MNTMNAADTAFMQDMDRAARSLRAAVSSALMQGLGRADVIALVAAGINDAADMPLTKRAQERSAALNFHPTGEDIIPTGPENRTADDTGYLSRPRPLFGGSYAA